LGYGLEWQVLNSKDFGVPQSRKRVYIVGFLDKKCAGKILPLRGKNTKTLIQTVSGRQGSRVYSADGLAKTLLSKSDGTGLYFIRCDHETDNGNSDILLIKEATKRGFCEAVPGDSVNLSYANQNQKRARVGKNIANTLDTGNQQGVVENSGRIRRLMPRECLRLQGFGEEQIDKILAVTSDSQAYKQAGNAVTVNIIHAIGLRIKAANVTETEVAMA
jgi:DNA (cytosine-5)-methyltransferase 1